MFLFLVMIWLDSTFVSHIIYVDVVCCAVQCLNSLMDIADVGHVDHFYKRMEFVDDVIMSMLVLHHCWMLKRMGLSM